MKYLRLAFKTFLPTLTETQLKRVAMWLDGSPRAIEQIIGWVWQEYKRRNILDKW